MADIHIRDVDPEIVREIEQRAARHGRSIEAESRSLLSDALATRPAKPSPDWREVAAKLRRETEGVPQTPAEILVRETRDEN